jgi:hypothetical protein
VRLQPWGVEKVDLSENRLEIDDQKCIGSRRKPLIGHTRAMFFEHDFSERVFQQPQAKALVDPELGCVSRIGPHKRPGQRRFARVRQLTGFQSQCRLKGTYLSSAHTHQFIQQSEDRCCPEVQQFIRYIQSALRACIGSIEAARSAGMNPAIEAQIVRSRIAPKNASGSSARTP